MRIGRVATIMAVVLLPAATGSLSAQKFSPPTDVTVVARGASATVSWTPVSSKGVTYRVLRSLDPRKDGVELATAVDGASYDDGKLSAGTTYFYQVVAMYPEGGAGPAAPVAFTVQGQEAISPATSPSPPKEFISGNPVPLAPGSVIRRLATAVTGVTVTGATTASAIVSWQPVQGVTSYSVIRAVPGQYGSSAVPAATGLTIPSWTDNGPLGIGFVTPGAYGYRVDALLAGGTTVSGQASWTRPDPTCAAPPPGQQPLAVLDPTSGNQLHWEGPYPDGAMFTWTRVKTSILAYRVERSVQGTNAWMPAGTSCTGAPPVSVTGTLYMAFADPLGGTVPGTTYLYRMTALSANGEAGWNTVAWTAPNPGALHWGLNTSATTTKVTLQWRYESALTLPAETPLSFEITAAGSTHMEPGPCSSQAGCTWTTTTSPKGVQQFRVTARWRGGARPERPILPNAPTLGALVADTTLTVP